MSILNLPGGPLEFGAQSGRPAAVYRTWDGQFSCEIFGSFANAADLFRTQYMAQGPFPGWAALHPLLTPYGGQKA